MTAAPAGIAVFVAHDLGPLRSDPLPAVQDQDSESPPKTLRVEAVRRDVGPVESPPVAPTLIAAAPMPVTTRLAGILDAVAGYLPWLWIVGGTPLAFLLTTAGLVARAVAPAEPARGGCPHCRVVPAAGRVAEDEDIAPRCRGGLRSDRQPDSGRHFASADPLACRGLGRLGPAATGDGPAARVGPRPPLRQPGEPHAADHRIGTLLPPHSLGPFHLGPPRARALLRRCGGRSHPPTAGLRNCWSHWRNKSLAVPRQVRRFIHRLYRRWPSNRSLAAFAAF